MTGGECPTPLRNLSPYARRLLDFLTAFSSQIRVSMDGAVAFDFGALRQIAQDLGFDTTGTDEYSEGALFWTYLRSLAEDYFAIAEEIREQKRIEAELGGR